MQLTKKIRGNLNLTLRVDKIVVWRRITRALKDIYENDMDVVNKDTQTEYLGPVT